jgi:hypothetical protein
MPRIRLLVSVAGDHRSAVYGDAGTVLDVDNKTARVWCDGERAERVLERSVPVEKTADRTGGPVMDLTGGLAGGRVRR